MRRWTEAQPAVAGYVHAVLRDSTAAKDVLQETALTLLRKFPDYDAQRPFLPWALGVAKFQILGHWRDTARSRILFDTDLLERFTATWVEMAPAQEDHTAALQRCLAKLADRALLVVRLRYFEALDSTQIANTIGSNAGAVRVLLQRARAQLRLCVERQLRAEKGM